MPVNFCSEPGCVGLAATGKFCPAHVADNYLKRRDAARPERDSWYDKAAWRSRLRPYKLQHDPMCETDGCGKPATEVHHQDDSWKTTGDWRLFIDYDNLMSLCHECHSRITMEEQRKNLCINGR